MTTPTKHSCCGVLSLLVLGLARSATAFTVAPIFRAASVARHSAASMAMTARRGGGGGGADPTIMRWIGARRQARVRFDLSSYEGGDFPSDVGDTATAVLAGDNPELRSALKREILFIAASSNRGQVATQEEKDAAIDLIYQLEALNPTPDATNVNIIGGVWELVYTDTQPFRCSPFFMAIGELFGKEKDRADTLFSLHRAATSNGEIGRVRQTISEATLVSEVDLKVGLISGLPMAIRGTVVTKARLSPISSDSFTVAVESTSVTNNNILSFLDGAVQVPVEKIYKSLRGSVPETKLSTFYLDEEMRISRTSDDHVFVFVKTPPSS